MNGCACHGYTLTFECTVGGEGVTVWQGTAFDCRHSFNAIIIVLLHSHFIRPTGTTSTCNNGAIAAAPLPPPTSLSLALMYELHDDVLCTSALQMPLVVCETVTGKIQVTQQYCGY